MIHTVYSYLQKTVSNLYTGSLHRLQKFRKFKNGETLITNTQNLFTQNLIFDLIFIMNNLLPFF